MNAREFWLMPRKKLSACRTATLARNTLLLGLLREEKCFAAEILHERGLRLSTIREELARTTQEKAQPQRQREIFAAERNFRAI